MNMPFTRRDAAAGVASAGLCALLFLGGCGERNASAEATPPPAKAGSLQIGATAQPDTAKPHPAVEPRPAAEPSPAAEPRPADEARPADDPQPDPKVVDPGGVVEVTATREGLTRIGAAKCKACHVVQFDSWSAGAHAKRTPPLDCESCHGAGSQYKSMTVMKDPAKARAAGLVMPGREFCATCHRSGLTDDMLSRAHAHKVAVGAR